MTKKKREREESSRPPLLRPQSLPRLLRLLDDMHAWAFPYVQKWLHPSDVFKLLHTCSQLVKYTPQLLRYVFKEEDCTYRFRDHKHDYTMLDVSGSWVEEAMTYPKPFTKMVYLKLNPLLRKNQFWIEKQLASQFPALRTLKLDVPSMTFQISTDMFPTTLETLTLRMVCKEPKETVRFFKFDAPNAFPPSLRSLTLIGSWTIEGKLECPQLQYFFCSNSGCTQEVEFACGFFQSCQNTLESLIIDGYIKFPKDTELPTSLKRLDVRGGFGGMVSGQTTRLNLSHLSQAKTLLIPNKLDSNHIIWPLHCIQTLSCKAIYPDGDLQFLSSVVSLTLRMLPSETRFLFKMPHLKTLCITESTRGIQHQANILLPSALMSMELPFADAVNTKLDFPNLKQFLLRGVTDLLTAQVYLHRIVIGVPSLERLRLTDEYESWRKVSSTCLGRLFANVLDKREQERLQNPNTFICEIPSFVRHSIDDPWMLEYICSSCRHNCSSPSSEYPSACCRKCSLMFCQSCSEKTWCHWCLATQ